MMLKINEDKSTSNAFKLDHLLGTLLNNDQLCRTVEHLASEAGSSSVMFLPFPIHVTIISGKQYAPGVKCAEINFRLKKKKIFFSLYCLYP